MEVPAASPPRKEHPVSTEQQAGWSPEPVWTFRGEGGVEKISCRSRSRTPDRQFRSLLPVPVTNSPIHIVVQLILPGDMRPGYVGP